MKYEILVLALLTILLIPSTIALKCYVCNSNDDVECASDELPDRFKRTCNIIDKPYCRKIVQTIYEVESIVRVCGHSAGSKDCYKTPGTNNAHVCSCNRDYCNSASKIGEHQQITAMISATIVLLVSIFIIH